MMTAGQNATFSVTATNVATYQWQQWNGTAWVNIAGANASTFTVNAATVAMNTNTFRAVLNGLCTIVNSGAATLFVNPLPTISIAAITLNALQSTQSTNVVATVNPPGGSFVWTRNGTNIGVSGPTVGPLTVDNLGTYLAVYTDPNGCQVTSASLVISALASDNIWIYPNPNSGQFNVRYYNQSGEGVTIKVFNALGQLVYQKATATGTPYSLTSVILPATAPNGVYEVKVLGASGKELAAKKIIVQRN
jgi:Secretion system C-terminal sorting domain